MKTNKSLFTNWLFSEFAPINKSLPIFRVIYASVVLLTIMPRQLWVSNYPDTFFLPRIGITFFFGELPEAWFFYLLNFLLVLSLLCLLVGYKTFYSSLSVALLFLIGNSWSYSFGKINHDIFLIVIPLVLAASCWDRRLTSNKEVPSSKSWPIAIFALLLGLAMFTAALPKILTGWLDPSASALTGQLVQNYFENDRQTLLSTFLLSNYNFYLFKLLDYATVFIELAFIFSIFSLRYFRAVCAMACLFHLGVQLTLEITFIANILAYGLFVDWSKLSDFKIGKRALNTLDSKFKNTGFIKLAALSIPIGLIYVLIGNPFLADLGLNYYLGGPVLSLTVKLTAAAIALWYLSQLVRAGFSKTSQRIAYGKA